MPGCLQNKGIKNSMASSTIFAFRQNIIAEELQSTAAWTLIFEEKNFPLKSQIFSGFLQSLFLFRPKSAKELLLSLQCVSLSSF